MKIRGIIIIILNSDHFTTKLNYTVCTKVENTQLQSLIPFLLNGQTLTR